MHALLNWAIALSDVRTLFFDNSLIALHSFSFAQKIKDHSSLLSVRSIYKSDVPSSAEKKSDIVKNNYTEDAKCRRDKYGFESRRYQQKLWGIRYLRYVTSTFRVSMIDIHIHVQIVHCTVYMWNFGDICGWRGNIIWARSGRSKLKLNINHECSDL